jgi:hypothetical protein
MPEIYKVPGFGLLGRYSSDSKAMLFNLCQERVFQNKGTGDEIKKSAYGFYGP